MSFGLVAHQFVLPLAGFDWFLLLDAFLGVLLPCRAQKDLYSALGGNNRSAFRIPPVEDMFNCRESIDGDDRLRDRVRKAVRRIQAPAHFRRKLRDAIRSNRPAKRRRKEC